MIFTTIIITTTTINRRIMLPELEFPQAGVAQVGYVARCDSPDQENDEQDDNDDAENDDDDDDDDQNVAPQSYPGQQHQPCRQWRSHLGSIVPTLIGTCIML